MKEWIAVAVLLYSVPLFALLLTWKKPLWQALRGIVLSEVLGILCFFPLYALVGMLSWQWFRWGGVSLQEILSFWKGGGATAALWIGPGVGETALVLLLRWVVETVRQRLALPGRKACHDRGSTQRRGGLMELRQTIRTGIRNIRRAWWEPGLMLALSALLVAAAWLWIPAPWWRTRCRRSCCISKWTAGPMAWSAGSPKPWWSGRRPGPLWTTWPPSIRKTPSARPIRPWRAGPICTSTFGRRTATRWWRSRWAAASAGGSAIPGWRRPGPWRRRVLQPQDLEAYVLAQIHGALSGESL
ncbi:MAG: hypothetical protein ACLR1T_09885 [Evtepia gabavorous]